MVMGGQVSFKGYVYTMNLGYDSYACVQIQTSSHHTSVSINSSFAVAVVAQLSYAKYKPS